MNLFLGISCFIILDTVGAEEWHFAGVNIALGKSTRQSPSTYDNYGPDLAVDGNTDANAYHNSCSHTDGPSNTKATWTVIFNGSYTLKGIRVFNRVDLRYRLRNFKIVGLPTFTELHDDAVANPQLYNNIRIDVAIDSNKKFSAITIEIPPHSGYPDDGRPFLTLCEVKIYSENHDCSMPSSNDSLVKTLRQGTGYWNTEKDLISTWTVLDFRCNGHYTLEGSETISCLPGGVYNASVSTCVEMTCSKPQVVINGYYVQPDKARYSIGDTVTWRCDQGYKSEQNRSRQCLPSATWSGEQSTCERITCSFPGNVTNGYFKIWGNVEYRSGNVGSGTAVNIFCAEGFQANAPDINCKEDGQWDILPACTRIECNRLEKLNGGYYAYVLNDRDEKNDNEVYEFGTVATAFCNETFFKASDEREKTRICGQNGSWTGHEDLCVKYGCPLLNGSNYLQWTVRNGSGFSSPAYGLVSSGAIADFVCLKDYSLVGAESIVCLQSGTYNTRVPYCIHSKSEGQPTSYGAEIAGGVSGGFVFGVVVGITVVWLVWRSNCRKKQSEQQTPFASFTRSNPELSSSVDGDHLYAQLETAAVKY